MASKTQKGLISVIIPVYNVEKYINECLNSVINQEYKNIEIICVNDGSTDKSMEKLEEFGKKDSRIRIISRENKGSSYARNLGLKESEGEYIYFLDSDDYISKDYLKNMYEKMAETDADIVFNDNIISFDDTNRTKTKQVIKNKLENGIYKVDPEFINKRFLNPVVWSKLYKKSLITDNNIEFPIGLISEDAYFYFALMPFINTAVQNNEGTYYYRERENSLTHQSKKIYKFDCIRIFELIYDFYKKNNFLGKYHLPYRLIAYRSTQNGSYKEYRKEVLKLIDSYNLDVELMKKDKKLNLLLRSPNKIIYGINKFLCSKY